MGVWYTCITMYVNANKYLDFCASRTLKNAEHRLITIKYLATGGIFDSRVCGLGTSATSSTTSFIVLRSSRNIHFCLSDFITGSIGVLHGLTVGVSTPACTVLLWCSLFLSLLPV